MASAACISVLLGGLLEKGGKLSLMGETTIQSFDIYIADWEVVWL